MSRVKFELENHPLRPGIQVIGIWIDGVRCAAISPGEVGDATIRIVSAHFKDDDGVDKVPSGVTLSMATGGMLPIPVPVVQVEFDVRPYKIEGDKLVRLP
jgi:hypothetical protein